MQTNNTYTGATVLYSGTLDVNKLANGGVASSIGASQNYDFNCILKAWKAQLYWSVRLDRPKHVARRRC